MLVDLYNQLLLISIIAGLLYLILKLFGIVTHKYFSAAWHYYTYLLISTFFLIPYHSLLSMFNIFIRKAAEWLLPMPPIINSRPYTNIILNNRVIQVFEKSYETAYSYAELFPYFLMAGTSIFITIAVCKNIKINQRILKACKITDDKAILNIFSECKRSMGIKKEIPIHICNYAGTPFVTGLFRPRIVLPDIEFNFEELGYIFKHELTHLKQYDAWIKLLLLFINALHWFNPFAYMIICDIDRYCETMTDQRVTVAMNTGERRIYCELILSVLWNVADQKTKIFSAFSDKQQLERRINVIMKNEKGKKWVKVLAISMTLTFLLTGAVAAYAAYAAYAVSDKGIIEADTSVDMIFVQPGEKAPTVERENISSGGIAQVTGNGLNLFATGVGPMSTFYITNSKINGNSAMNYTSPTGNAFDLVKGRKVYYDLTWFPRNTLKIGLYDVEAQEVKNLKTIKNGSATGSIKVPVDGLYYFYVWNTEDDKITLNGTIDP